ncbi:hypothetical protein Daus18300_014137 [Diaporthe australafricana]|uniref:Uncharacterized protein n=1 Tax=Diaporthe australafricana TaxID=127596 RepID=A0ABR3VWJ0_9PEZI
MCYKLNHHHSAHDVRPRFAYSGLQTSVELVNPYAAPHQCCAQDATIASWFACPFGHGCCYYCSKIVKCTAADALEPHCGNLTAYHTYEENTSVIKAKKWLSLSVLDQEIGSTQGRHGDFPPHHEVVWEMGNEVEDLAEDLEELTAEFFDLKALHTTLTSGWRCDAHDICTRVLQSHECREFALREELQVIDDDLSEMESEIVALEIKVAIRRLRFDATAFGFTGKCDINRMSL